MSLLKKKKRKNLKDSEADLALLMIDIKEIKEDHLLQLKMKEDRDITEEKMIIGKNIIEEGGHHHMKKRREDAESRHRLPRQIHRVRHRWDLLLQTNPQI